jgi:hypothetical protein
MLEKLPFSSRKLELIANIISRCFDIDVVVTILLFICFFYARNSTHNPFLWLMIGLGILVVIPVVAALYLVKTKRVSDWDLSIRRERIEFISLETIARLGLLLLASAFNAPMIFKVTFLILFAIEFVFSFITMFWKISVHAQLTTLLICYSVVFGGWKFAFTLIFLPLIFFARLYLKKHTPAQLLAGSAVTFVMCLSILKVFGY